MGRGGPARVCNTSSCRLGLRPIPPSGGQYSGNAVCPFASFVVGFREVWFARTGNVSLDLHADLDVVHNARTLTIPTLVLGSEHLVSANLVLCCRCATYVPVGRDGRGTRQRRVA